VLSLRAKIHHWARFVISHKKTQNPARRRIFILEIPRV
jgi:hypothetical protein